MKKIKASILDALANSSDSFEDSIFKGKCEPLPKEALVLVPGNSLITATPEEGRKLAITLAQHTIHNIQPCLNKLKDGRGKYSTNPSDLIQAEQAVAIEFATIAKANNYWRK